MHKTILTLLLICSCGYVTAQSADIRISVPKHIEFGEQFFIKFASSKDIEKVVFDESLPFNILYGPIKEQPTVPKNNNESECNTLYVFKADKEGIFNVGSGRIYFKDGTSVESQNYQIFVGKGLPWNQKERTLKKDLFMRTTVDRQTITKDENITASIKLYTTFELKKLSGFIKPRFEEFEIAEVDLNKDRSFNLEKINGKFYYTYTLKEYVLLPNASGNFTISSAEALVTVSDNGKNKTLSKKIKTKNVTIVVR